MHSVPVFRLAAWGWFTGCVPSPGWEEASDWVGAKKGTNECHGKTGTDRGSTLVHTAEERTYYYQLITSKIFNFNIFFTQTSLSMKLSLFAFRDVIPFQRDQSNQSSVQLSFPEMDSYENHLLK